MHSNLVRPFERDENHNAMGGTSESGLYSGDKVVPTEEEESRTPVMPARPYSPTKAEIKEHYPLHLHYRSWCPDCVRGK